MCIFANMSDCNHIIEAIYKNESLNRLIDKINPANIREDLKQEVILALLEKDCDYLTILHHEGNLIRYTLRIAWNMATSANSTFFYKYKKCDMLKAVEYLKSLQPAEILISHAHKAQKVLDSKTADIYQDHERRIFNKFVELGTMRKVAKHFNIPLMHVSKIVNKVKKELIKL